MILNLFMIIRWFIKLKSSYLNDAIYTLLVHIPLSRNTISDHMEFQVCIMLHICVVISNVC